MVSHLPGPTRSSTSPSSDSQPFKHPIVSMRTWIGAFFLLPLVGLLLGATTTGIGRAIVEVYSQVSTRSFGSLFELLAAIVFSLINVLAVAGSAIVAGAQIGIYGGSAMAVMLLLLAGANMRMLMPLRSVAMVALAIAGGAGAWYGASATGSATNLYTLLSFVAGGALFGLLAAQSILPRQPRAQSELPSRQPSTDHLRIAARAIGTTPLPSPTQRRRIPAAYIIVAIVVAVAILCAAYFLVAQSTGLSGLSPATHESAALQAGTPISSANAGDVVELAKLEIGGVRHAIFSSDGMTLAVASTQGVQFYDSATLTLQQSIETGPSKRIALSPDGSILATISTRDVQLWQTADGELIRTLSGHADDVEEITFSPDGRVLASASLDRTARLWRLSTGELLFTMLHVGKVFSLAFDADGDRLLTGSSMGTTLWQSSTGARLALLDIVFASVHDVGFSPDAQRAAAVMSSGIFRLWDSNSHQRIHNLSIQGELTALAFSPDGTLLAIGGADQKVRLLEVEGGTVAGTLSGHQGIISSVAFHPDAHLLATTGSDGTLRIWGMKPSQTRPNTSPTPITKSPVAATSTPFPTATTVVSSTQSAATATLASDFATVITADNVNQITEQYVFDSGDAADIAYAPDGKLIAIAERDRLLLLDGENFNHTRTIDTFAARIAISPDSQLIATAQGELATIRSLQSGEVSQELEIHAGTVTDLAFSPDGEVLATASLDHRVRLWRVEAGTLIRQLSHFGAVQSVAFSPDGAQLVAGTSVGITSWRVSDGARLSILAVTTHVANRMAYSPDGSDLAAAMSNGEIWLWHLDTGGRAVTLSGHAQPVRSIAFSPSGELLVSAGNDGTIHLWRASTGSDLRVLLGHSEPVTALAFHPKGGFLLSTSLDGTTRLWAAPPN